MSTETETPAEPKWTAETIVRMAETGEVSEEQFTRMLEGFVESGMTFQQLKGLTDENMEAVYSVAYGLYQGGKYEESHSLFNFLCLHNQYAKKFWLGLAGCRQMLDHPKEALAAYLCAQSLDMDDPTIALQIARCQLALGNDEAAQAALKIARTGAAGHPEQETVRARAAALNQLIEQKTANAAGKGAAT